MNTISNGIWTGLVATGPMTLGFFNFFEHLSKRDQNPLPPSILTETFEKKLGLPRISNTTHAHLTMASHFGYGAVTGLIYALLAKKSPVNPLIKGAIYGLGVWGLSYKGWIPRLGFHPQARNMSPARNTMMIVSHLIWGRSLGYATQALERSGRKILARGARS